jgi:hypothetical protein
MTSGEVLAEIERLEPPAEGDAEVFELLKAEFVRELEKSGLTKFESGVPQGDSGRVSDLEIDYQSGTITWTYTNLGDYDGSGEVGVPDITPIAQYYLANPSDGLGDDALESWIDGDDSNDVGISDITPIAQNYLNDVAGYVIATADLQTGLFTPIGDPVLLDDGEGIPTRFSAALPAGASAYIAVIPFDSEGNNGPRSYSIPTSPGNLPPTIDSLTVDASYLVSATFSDLDGDPVTVVSWEVTAGNGTVTALTEDGTGATAQFTPPGAGSGTSTITLTITDGVNAPVSDGVDVNYTVGDPPAITDVSPLGGKTGVPAQFTATVTGSEPLTYDWSFGGGATPDTSGDVSPLVTLGAIGEYGASLTLTNPWGSDTFDFTLSVAEGGFCPCEDELPEDTVVLCTPTTQVKVGDYFYVFLAANVAPGKPMANLNAARILVNVDQLLASEIGVLTLSDVNMDFDNPFAEYMRDWEPELFNMVAPYDFWDGFADPVGVSLLTAPALPQDTFVDVGVNWGPTTMEKSGGCIIAVVKFEAVSIGTAELQLQGVDEEERVRTYYSDLASENHEFAAIGGPISVEVVDTLQVPPEIRLVDPQYGIESETATMEAVIRGGAPDTYAWDFGGGASPNTSSDPAPEITFGAAGQYNASLTVTNTWGEDTYDYTLIVESAPIDPFEGIADDTIFLYAPETTVALGDYFWVFLCAKVAGAKPMANMNAARLLVAKSNLRACDIGCLELSQTNPEFANDFAEVMRLYDIVLYNRMERYDFWDGFGDQSGVALLVSPALPQTDFVDAGVNWGGNDIDRTGAGVLAVLRFRTVSAGQANIDLQLNDGDQDRTFYSDLSFNMYLFTNAGDPIVIDVS